MICVWAGEVWAGEPGEGGPPPLDETLNKIAESVAKAVPPADNAAALAAITEEGMNEAERGAQAAEQDDALTNIVRTLVQARMKTHVYAGMCARNYTQPCADGWTETKYDDGNILCSAAEAAEDLPSACTAYNVSEPMSAQQKSTIAVSCRAQWPCAACTRDFTNCPLHFRTFPTNEKGNCVPDHTYVGPCMQSIDFRKITDTAEKARWAARCITKWPCYPE